MNRLTEFETEALRVLATCDATSGFDVKWIARHSAHPYCSDLPRARSGAVSSVLLKMERDGLVRRLDGEKPIVWTITEDGRKAVQ